MVYVPVLQRIGVGAFLSIAILVGIKAWSSAKNADNGRRERVEEEHIMQIAKNRVVQFHYTLTNSRGETVDQSDTSEPVLYLHGHLNILLSLEQALEGKVAGDSLDVELTASQAYGRHNPAKIERVPIKRLGRIDRRKIKKGALIELETEQGVEEARIIKVGKFNVDIDRNHPLAGEDLCFNVEIVSVRDADDEEISHGHAHGPGGHQHE